jgi:hypothetical protein
MTNLLDVQPWPLANAIIVALCGLLHVAERIGRSRLPEIRARLSGPVGGLLEGVMIGAVWGLSLAAGGRGGEFIYFQF